MRLEKLYRTAQLLKSGLVVQLEGDTFRAIKFNGAEDDSPCYSCSLDSICKGDVAEVCNELDSHGADKWLLELAHPL